MQCFLHAGFSMVLHARATDPLRAPYLDRLTQCSEASIAVVGYTHTDVDDNFLNISARVAYCTQGVLL